MGDNVSSKRGGKSMKILLVEDNVCEADLTREALLESGILHELFVVQDGEAAIEFLRREGGYSNAVMPNIILLDLNMPRKGGLEVLSEIKRDAALCRIPVIVVSNSKAIEDIDAVYQLGGNSYLVKCGDLDEYFASAKALVEFWMRKAQLPSVPRNDGHPALHA